MINWQLHAYDGDERRWLGYVDGEEEYWVHRGGYGCSSDMDFGDGCESEMEGINCCEAHHRYGPLWVDGLRNDPLLRREIYAEDQPDPHGWN
jgi:hypothetical protein